MKQNFRDVFEEIAHAVQATTGATVKISPKGNEQAGITIRHHDQKFEVEGTFIPTLTSSNLGSVLSLLSKRSTARRALLITRHVNPAQAEKLRNAGTGFLDSAGNAYLDLKPLLFFVTGRKPFQKSSPVAKNNLAFSPAGLKVIFVLLSLPKAVEFTTRELSAAAGISIGAVNYVLADLSRNGFLHRHSRTRRSLLKKKELLEKFVRTYPDRLRPKLVRKTFVSNRPLKELAQFEFSERQAFWSGEAVPWRTGKRREPGELHLYSNDALKNFKLQGGLIPTSEGAIVLLDQFWEFETWEGREADLAPPVLIYADLLSSQDARTRELAEEYYEQSIAGLVE
jgi:hypothetical protein